MDINVSQDLPEIGTSDDYDYVNLGLGGVTSVEFFDADTFRSVTRVAVSLAN